MKGATWSRTIFFLFFFSKMVQHLGFSLCFPELALVAKNGLYQSKIALTYDLAPRPLGLLLCPAVSGGHGILLGDRFRTKLTYTPPLLHASIELGCKKT
jgi:hypothetical protein